MNFSELDCREIRSLSIKQPFTTLMMFGKVETKTQPTKYRGLVLLCSCKVPYNDRDLIRRSGYNLVGEIWQMLIPFLPNGKAIAIGELVDCRKLKRDDHHYLTFPTGIVAGPGDHAGKNWDQAIGDVFWGWHFENVIPIEPFDFRGQLGLPRVSQEIKAKIKPFGDISSYLRNADQLR